VIEVDMVQNTIETLTNYIAGNQLKNVNNGILTYYDENGIITKQFDIFEIKEDVGDVPLYEVKEERKNIDESQTIENVTDGI
jgi:hypothetical protein